MSAKDREQKSALSWRVLKAACLNKMANKSLCHSLNRIESGRLKRVAEVEQESQQIQKEMEQLQNCVTPSLRSLELETLPDLPKSYLSLKRLSLPSNNLQDGADEGNQLGMAMRRPSSAYCSEELQKKVSDFVKKMERPRTCDVLQAYRDTKLPGYLLLSK